MLRNKKILITAGGTQEYIDDVRVLTNISTGLLGYKIALQLAEAGAQVFYVCSKTSVQPNVSDPPMGVRVVRTANDAMEAMKKIIIEEKIDAVIHSMAVSDFTFKRDQPIKCKSNDPEGFIDYLRQTITMNPKIISHIKEWRPETILIGFKFEVGITTEDLVALARASIQKNGCDLVIANDKKEMERAKRHIAHFVYSEKMSTEFGFADSVAFDKDGIATMLCNYLISLWRLPE